jgi:ABC-type transport system involved in multi-copper enzyme maturation permease subunit
MNPRWRLWATQMVAIARLELKTSFSLRRAFPVYLLALMPFVIFAGHAMAHLRGWRPCDGSSDLAFFAGVFQIFVLRLVVFFGCVVIFLRLFRGEVLQKSLHYYFLAPVRREVLVAGKYLAGAITAIAVFAASTVVSYMVILQHLALTNSSALAAPAMKHMAAYAGVTALACLGYGAVFLLLGMLFRNPIIPAILVLLWESFIMFYPALLKKISVIFYLESLCPVRVPFDGGFGPIFAIPAEPTPAYLAIPGLLLLIAAIVTLAAVRIRKMEISYGTE